jgi:hypothetical protein
MPSLSKLVGGHVVLTNAPAANASKTLQYRAAFQMMDEGSRRPNKIAEICRLPRKTLKAKRAQFLASKLPIEEWHFVPGKRGRKPLLDEKAEVALKIAAHTLDHVGHPCSRSFMNEMIKNLKDKNQRGSRSTFFKWRRRARMPRKVVRNGPAIRAKKSEVDFIDGFHCLMKETVTKYGIKREFM